jgi:hypothetical protein
MYYTEKELVKAIKEKDRIVVHVRMWLQTVPFSVNKKEAMGVIKQYPIFETFGGTVKLISDKYVHIGENVVILGEY